MEQSRLGKLLSLLDAKNAIVRRQAAQQIGDVARLHPSHLNSLLSSLRGCMKNPTNWDTRVAAALALKEICRNIVDAAAAAADGAGENGSTIADGSFVASDSVVIFDLRSAIASGFRLLGSEGKEFDVTLAECSSGNAVESTTAADRQSQRLRVAQQLGFLIPQISDVAEIVTDDDLTYCRGNEKGATRGKDVVSDPTPPKLFKLEPLEAGGASLANAELEPKILLANFIRSLCVDLYDPNWTSRHGAALALKEAASCSQFSALFDLHNWKHSQKAALLSAVHVLHHIFNVLAVDRFNDFVGDHVVAPVRETCAQLIAAVLLCFRQSHLKISGGQATATAECVETTLIKDALRICWEFLTFRDDPKQWECRHAGLLTVKYVIGAMQNVGLLRTGYGFDSHLCNIFDAAVVTLEDSNDDVVITAAQALLPLVDALKQALPSKIQGAIERCWQLLSKYVAPSFGDSLDGSAPVTAYYDINYVNDANSTCDDESAADGLFQLLESSPESLLIDDTRLLLLLPFFTHSQPQTRQRLASVLTRSARGGTLTLGDTVWFKVVVRTFFGCLADDHGETAERLASQLWPSLVDLKTPDLVWTLCRPILGQWLACLMVPEQTPLNAVIGGISSSHSSASQNLYLGGRHVSTYNDLDRGHIVLRARLRGARAFALICNKVIYATTDQTLDPRHCLNQLVSLHLSSNSAFQRAAVCIFLCEWSKLLSKVDRRTEIGSLFGDVKTTLEGLLGLSPVSSSVALTPTIYDEVLLNASEIHAACREFLSVTHSGGGGGDIQQISASAIVLNTKEAEETCARALEISIESRTSTLTPSELRTRYDHLKALIRRNAEHMDRINIRALAWLSFAYIRIGGIPTKFNPIIQPIMNCLKNEPNSILVQEAAHCLALLLELTPVSASSKVVKNLVLLHSSDTKTTPNLASSQESTGEKRILSWETKTGREGSTSDVDAARVALMARNAGFALKGVVGHFKEKMTQYFPNFYDSLTKELTPGNESDSVDQNVVNNMQILETVYPSLPETIRSQIREARISAMCNNLKHNSNAVRHMSCRCLAVMTATDLSAALNAVLPTGLELLSTSPSANENGDTKVNEEYGEFGATELIYVLVEKLNAGLIGVIPLLAVPILAGMSSSQAEIRPVAAYTFGQLVKLMPLETDDRPLPGLSEELSELRRRRLEFLHLLNRPEELGMKDGSGRGKQILNNIRLNAELRSYQRDGIVWLRFLAEYGLHGILCDDMGLGKTLQTLAALAAGLLDEAGKTRNASLIVCPKTLTSHWINEIRKFFSDGTETDSAVLKATCVIDRVMAVDFSRFDIVVASYDLFRKESTTGGIMDSILSYRWHYCILDEGHVIRNPKTRLFKALTQLKSGHRLILSGTPVQNSVLELWALFEFLMPGYLGTQAQFQGRFGKPILLSRDAKASSVEAEAGQTALENLHKLVLPFILRRRKCDVLDDLPPKIIQDTPCMLSPLQSQLYEDFSRAVKDKLSPTSGAASGGGGRRAVGAFQVLLYLRKLCDHPSLVMDDKHPNYSQVSERLREGEFGLDCRQLDDFRLSGKMLALRQLLSECGIGRHGETEDEDDVHTTVSPHRALIFCQFKTVIALVARYFDSGVFGHSVTYRRLDGDVPPAQRQTIVDQFNDDPSIDVLLLSTQIGGLGLNLTGADIVIFVDHDWNPANDLQAMDRAHRIGQKRTVNVYRLITVGTLEEKIMRLQQFKTRTADSLIGDENRSLMSMATDQLLDILTLDSSSSHCANGGDGSSAEAKAPKQRKCASRKSGENRGSETGENSSYAPIDLPSLWDQSQYDEAFDYNTFLHNLSS